MALGTLSNSVKRYLVCVKRDLGHGVALGTLSNSGAAISYRSNVRPINCLGKQLLMSTAVVPDVCVCVCVCVYMYVYYRNTW